MTDVGGAFLGYAVEKLLDEVLAALRLLKNAPKNILELHNLMERLQPSVKQICSFVQGEKHPADKWLSELREQLEKAHALVNASGHINKNIVRRYRTSKESLEVYASIQRMVQEASILHWASGMSIQGLSSDTDAKMLAEVRTALAGVEELRKIADLSSKGDILSAISKLDRILSSEIVGESSSSTVPTETQSTDSACDVPKPQVTFGGEAVANDLIDHLSNEECKKWVGLWGMGGIGKTFTTRKVFHDSRIQQHFSGGRFWLTVSKDQSGPHHLHKQLIEKIKGRGSVSELPENPEQAKSYLQSMLDRDRVLLVLDDVWQNDVLEYLDVISESKKGVVLVTTRDQGILRRMIGLVQIFEIPQLSSEDSWKLFSYYAGRGCGGVVPLEVEAVAKEMVNECRGLPLALEVIGSTMAGKELLPHEKALGQTTLRVWEIALERLRGANQAKGEYEALYLRLQLSVESLSEQDSRLQDCFFYFAAMQEDEIVNVENLVRLWVAEGLVQDDVNSSLSAEEEGKVLLGFLAAKSMIEVGKTGNFCKIHDVLRDLALCNMNRNIISGEEIQASARKCLYAPGLHLSNLPKKWAASSGPFSAKRLSLQHNDLQEFPKSKQFHVPHLQVLLLSWNRHLRVLSVEFFQHLSNLRALDLSRTGIERISSALLWRVKSLVLLSLRRCHHLVEVSDDINRLQNLKLLYLEGCNRLQKLPRVTNLTKLKEYSAEIPLKARMEEIPLEARMEACSVFRRCQWCGPWRMHGGQSRQGIPYMLPLNLRRLKLGFRDNTVKFLFDVSSLSFLEELHLSVSDCMPKATCLNINCGVQSILAGVMELHQLKVLEIEPPHQTPISALGKFPVLEDLTIGLDHNDGDTESYAYEEAFPSLKRFHLRCRPGMEKFVFHPGTMAKLETLNVNMSKTKQFPTSIVELRSLKRLELYSMEGVIRDEDLEFVFKHSDCFPHLQYLFIYEYKGGQPHEPPSPLSSRLSEHILERQRKGLLVIGHL